MKDTIIAQDNRLTTARYDLSLVEKRVFYLIMSEVRKKYIKGTIQQNLFEDLVLQISVADLTKQVKGAYKEKPDKKVENTDKKEVCRSLKALRLRSFDWDNGLDEDDEEYQSLNVGFINWSSIKKGNAEVEVSKKLMPFLVELATQFTPFSLNVAMSLKSKYSQRMYELCQKWQGTDGFRISVIDLRKMFGLENKLVKYAKFKADVLENPRKELKALYDIGQSDVYFEYSEDEKKGKTVLILRFKLFRKNSMNVKSTNDMLLELIPVFRDLFETSTKAKNDVFIKDVILQLQKYPNLIEPLNTRVKEILATGVKDDTARFIRFILNEDIMNYKEKPVKTKIEPKTGQKEAKTESKEPNIDPMASILGLASKKTV